jgi:hypothetical protein
MRILVHEVSMRKILAWDKIVLLVAGWLLVSAAAAPLAFADVGPKPTVDIAVRLNGAPVPDDTFYAQMLTCNAPNIPASERCGFDGPAPSPTGRPWPAWGGQAGAGCDKFIALAVPEPAEGCTWRLKGPPMVWGGECKGSQCQFSYILPERFRLAVYLTGTDRLFVSNPVTRTAMYSSYRLDLAEDGSARLVETTALPLRGRSHLGGALAALLLSLLIELAVGYIFVWLTHSPRRALLGVLVGNLLTVPALWFVVAATFPNGAFLVTLALAEVAVVVVEGLIIAALTRGQMRPTKAFVMSLLVNVMSFVLGAPALAFLAFFGIVQ